MAWERLLDLYRLRNKYQQTEHYLIKSKEYDQLNEIVQEDIFIYTSQLERISNSVEHLFQMIDTLIAQSIEFYLKSRIATFSPYILIAGSCEKWNGKDYIFSELHTINAHHLVNVLNTLSDKEDRLDDNFIRLYKEIKKERNSFIHSVSKRQSIDIKESVKRSTINILYIYKYIEHEKWIKWSDSREDYLTKYSPHFGDQSPYDPHENVVSEVLILLDILEPAQSEEYLSLNPKKYGRNYFCSKCSICDQFKREDTFFSKIDKSNKSHVQCCICGYIDHIERVKCIHEDCQGDVISKCSNVCLTCTISQIT